MLPRWMKPVGDGAKRVRVVMDGDFRRESLSLRA
jgi:hypothetical protein